ncbi:hypothetical protein GGR54DRAFT_560071 [Hypoxylon sp. NC1633]|nr:hypothetical protein GGR54DRAFT_560071 [Hypoxylon sp. NC1633]
MEQNKAEQSQGALTIETNNFHQVLEHFDQDGHIINLDTRFDIQCQVCLTRNLSVLNSKFDKRSRDTHETYCVFPRCGHAFGYTCIYKWITRFLRPQCPVCRMDIFSPPTDRGLLDLFGDGGIEEQHKEILSIREIFKQRIIQEQKELDTHSEAETEEEPEARREAETEEEMEARREARTIPRPATLMEAYTDMPPSTQTEVDFDSDENVRHRLQIIGNPGMAPGYAVFELNVVGGESAVLRGDRAFIRYGFRREQ